MHNNYYFLKQLSKELHSKIQGFIVKECFSQNKDELIIALKLDKKLFYIKAHFSSSFCCLSFPESFHRARKNSVDLFPQIIGKQIIEVVQYENERVFSLNLIEDTKVIFKMFGNRSNVLVSNKQEVESIFINRLSNDFGLDIKTIDRPIDQTKSNFIKTGGSVKELFPTFNKDVIDYLQKSGLSENDLDSNWQLIELTIEEMLKGKFYYSKNRFSLLPFENANEAKSPTKALNDFFLKYISSKQVNNEKGVLTNSLNNKIKSTKSYIDKTKKKLVQIEQKTNYQLFGDLIMANLHQIKKGSKSIELENFYDAESIIIIPLKTNLTPQKNAELFYKKSKNQNIEISKLKENIQGKSDLLEKLKVELKTLNNINDLKELRIYAKDNRLKSESNQKKEFKPYNEYTFQNFNIWIGKSAENNDKMLKMAYKEDLWLHAKDVSGSHVLIKYKSDTPFSKSVKEKAAALAAYYSKRKTDSLCPVIVTPKKFVRKRKGDPAGAVVVEKEEVILVSPEKWT